MQLKKLKNIIKSIGAPNKDDTLLGVFNGKTAQKNIEEILKVTDYTALQNLPRTLCSGTLELTEIADGGYESSGATSVTFNGVEKFKLDKGNLLFLKDNVVNIQTGFGCYCIDNIPEKANDDWTDFYGTTNKELQDAFDKVNSVIDNIPHGKHRLIASTAKKDENKNPIYNIVEMGNGLGLTQGTSSSTLNILPAQLNLSESQVTFTDPSDNTDITLSFKELLNDNIIPSFSEISSLTGCYQKIINTGIEEDCNIISESGWYISFDGAYSDKIIEPVTKQEVPIGYYVAMGDQFFVATYTANELHHIDYINIRIGDTSGNFAILYRKIAFNDNNEKVIDEMIDLLSSAEKSEKLIASINNLESNKLFYSQGIDEVTGLPKLQTVTIGNGLKFENGVLSIE